MHSDNCLNCETALSPDQKFCPNCGQKTDTHRLTLGHFFHDAFHAFTHADKGIFHLLKGLATKPGIVAREYIEGKRKKYFNPFTFFIIMMGVFVVSEKIFHKEDTATHAIPPGILKIPNEQAKQKAIGMYTRGMQVRAFSNKHGNIISMFAIPVLALIFWLAYYKRRYNYAEHLTANLMFTAFANIVFTLIVFPLQKLLMGEVSGNTLIYLGLLLQAAYYSWAYYDLMQIKTAGGTAKVIAVSIASIIIWTALSLTVMAIYIYQSADFYQFFVRMFGGGR